MNNSNIHPSLGNLDKLSVLSGGHEILSCHFYDSIILKLEHFFLTSYQKLYLLEFRQTFKLDYQDKPFVLSEGHETLIRLCQVTLMIQSINFVKTIFSKILFQSKFAEC